MSRVEASRSGEGAAYVAFDGHRGDDYRARTSSAPTTSAQTWRSVAGNIPAGQVRSRRPRAPAQPERCSSRARSSASSRAGTAARAGHACGASSRPSPSTTSRSTRATTTSSSRTHGRGVYVLDDLGVLAQADPAAPRRRPAPVRRRAGDGVPNVRAQGQHRAQVHGRRQSPRRRALTYFLKAKPAEKEEVTITITDAAGAKVRELKGPREKGFNQASWDLRVEPPVPPPAPGGRIVLRAAARSAREPGHVHGEGDGGRRLRHASPSSSRRIRASRSGPPSARSGSRPRARRPRSGAVPTPPAAR